MTAPRCVALALAASFASCGSPPSRGDATPVAAVSAREMLVARLTMDVIERVARMTDAEVVVELLRPDGADAVKGEHPAKAAPPPASPAPVLPVPLRANRISRT